MSQRQPARRHARSGTPARRVRTVACLLAGIWLTSLAHPSPAAAHATLLRADPALGGAYAAPPTAITLWFSEPVELRYSRIVLLAADGHAVDAGDLTTAGDDSESA